jgi:hypothetical protein
MKNKHLCHEDLIGYLYHTLDDAQRESIDAHLVQCSICRASLTEQEIRQRQISNELDITLNTVTPPLRMNFATLIPGLQVQPDKSKLWPRLVSAVPVTFALVGLFFALLGLWQAIGVQALTKPVQMLGAFPTLAGFFFVLASIGQFEQTPVIKPRWVVIWALALILWLGSAFIGLLDLIVLRDLVIMLVVAIGGSRAQAGSFGILAVFVGALLYIGLVIGSGEYHYRNLGQPGSWKLFSIVLLAQLFILILPYLLLL